MVPLPECSWSKFHLVTSTSYGFRFHRILHHFMGSMPESLPCLVELGFGRLKLASGAALGRPEENIPRGIKRNVSAAKPENPELTLEKEKEFRRVLCALSALQKDARE
jgi:hypothetical protein